MAQLLMLLGRWQVMESLGEQSSEAWFIFYKEVR